MCIQALHTHVHSVLGTGVTYSIICTPKYFMQSTDLSDYGWCRENDHLQVVWDAPDNVQRVQRTVDFLTQGCRCKTGCTTHRCKCRRENIMQCGPSCHCVNCKNIPTYVTQHADTEQELEEELQEDMRQHNDQTDSEVSENGSESSDEEDRLNGSESSDEEDRLNALNRDVDSIMEEVFGVPF